MNSENDDDTDTNVSINEEKHSKFVEDVINLDDKQYIKKPIRTEPTTEISEFHLVNSLRGNEGAVNINDLVRTIKGHSKYSAIEKQVRSFQKKGKTLEKPLEKPQEEKLKRNIGYQKVRKELDKWEPIVSHNRVATNLTFPLAKDINLEEDKKITTRFRVKSDLQEEIEKLEPKMEVHNVEEEKTFLLNMKEILERRRESAKLKAIQSYKAAKAKRQSKIKSKKYHRIQRRERLKQQLKEFEELQKNDPEQALRKLEEIEKARAEERLTLRHKSTGKWARNKQIRAKYDKESRQALVQQLKVSRDLTQKLKVGESSDSEDDTKAVNTVIDNESNNPWVSNDIKASKDVVDFISGYRKYWDEKNKNAKSVEDKQQTNLKEKMVYENDGNNSHSTDVNYENQVPVAESLIGSNKNFGKEEIQEQPENSLFNEKHTKKIAFREKKKKENVNGTNIDSKKQKNSLKKKKVKSLTSTSDWEVSSLDTDTIIDNLSYMIQDRIKKELEEKTKILKKKYNLECNKGKKRKIKNKNSNINKKIDLSLHSEVNYPDVDEMMIEQVKQNTEDEIIQEKNSTDFNRSDHENILDTIFNSKEQENSKKNVESGNVDPNKFIVSKPINLDSKIPELLSYDDNFEDQSQRDAITEAFEDDEIVNEFNKVKRSEIENDKPKDVDLTLPGWGSWGGTGINITKHKRKRFIIRFPKKISRKDRNKANLIIKENKKSVKPHMVSELPFPFKKVKDFEASIRAPIGNTFIPETAFRKNIKPAIMTKIGSVIEPIDEDILLRKKKNV